MVYRGYVKGGMVVLDPKVELPEGIEVRVEPLPPPSGKTLAERLGDLVGSVPDLPPQRPTLAEQFADIIGTVPELPPDMAAQHDHYLHGAPKR